MKQKINDLYNLINKNKKTKIFTIVIILFTFIVTIGYSLAFFTSLNNNLVANIVVNNLKFNMTTNNGTSDDRILRLKAGAIEEFVIVLTNLNNLPTKYEITYEICDNENCDNIINVSADIKEKLIVQNDCTLNPKIHGTIYPGASNQMEIKIYTQNINTENVYIKLNLQAGYVWNVLELTNQIGNGPLKLSKLNVESWINGVKVDHLPSTCNYKASMKAYKDDEKLSFENTDKQSTIQCDNNKWSISLQGFEEIPDKIVLNFTTIDDVLDPSMLSQSYPYKDNQDDDPYIFEAPTDGVYKLEVWGAQGGYSSSYGTGGYGGYSTGEISLEKGQKIYIYVGSMPIHPAAGRTSPGGYNGGGGSGGKVSDGSVCYGGGGATHMATSEGLLSTFTYGDQESIAKILIVAGGGGGGIAHVTTLGGSGGGYIGSTGTTSISDYNNATRLPGGGTQTGTGHHDTYSPAGKFGAANTSNYDTNGGGGGGGFWGGSSGRMSTGAGGSGYIGNSRLTYKKMFCYACIESNEIEIYTINTINSNSLNDKVNCPDGYSEEPISKCAKAGDGYAKITFINDANYSSSTSTD